LGRDSAVDKGDEGFSGALLLPTEVVFLGLMGKFIEPYVIARRPWIAGVTGAVVGLWREEIAGLDFRLTPSPRERKGKAEEVGAQFLPQHGASPSNWCCERP